MKMMWCWRCGMEVPMLDEEEFRIASNLHREGFLDLRSSGGLDGGMQPLLNYYNDLTGFNETVPNAIMHHSIAQQGKPCEHCGKPYRTPLASLCAACGHKRDLSEFSLKDMFRVLGGRYNGHVPAITQLWQEISSAYSDPQRHYHTLRHLEHMLSELIAVKDQINDWDAVLFALYYHDSVYKALKSNNEEASANLAEERIKTIHVSAERIQHCKAMILATKGHGLSANSDINFFTDADLSVLGQDWSMYSEYMQHIKKEYSMVPGFVYRMNRKKMLNRFLQMTRIFKTDHFYATYEVQARKNIEQELNE